MKRITVLLWLALVCWCARGQESSAPQKQVHIHAPVNEGDTVTPAKLLKKVNPDYPPLARQVRISGTVKLHVVITKDGTVEQLAVEFGHPLLVQAAMDAVRQWKYEPTRVNGEPVEVDTTIDVVFTLNADSQNLPRVIGQAHGQVDPALRQDVLKLMEVTRAEANSAAAMRKLMDSFRPMMFRSITDEAQRERLINSFEQKLEGVLKSDAYREGMIVAYARYFDDNDVKALVAFYQTPTGQKFNESMPKFLNDLMEIGQERVPGILKELCAENPDLSTHLPNCQLKDDKRSQLTVPESLRRSSGE